MGGEWETAETLLARVRLRPLLFGAGVEGPAVGVSPSKSRIGSKYSSELADGALFRGRPRGRLIGTGANEGPAPADVDVDVSNAATVRVGGEESDASRRSRASASRSSVLLFLLPRGRPRGFFGGGPSGGGICPVSVGFPSSSAA